MGDRKIIKKIKKPSGKVVIIVMLMIIVMLGIILAVNIVKGDEAVEYRILEESEIPSDITGQVIPEYRDLERALACTVGDKIYVVVTRGEKPTSGYELAIDRMGIENKDGKGNLIVYAKFKDPEPGNAIAQVLTYPIQVAETQLENLPDSIELRVEY